jgi:hypothetical protein
LEEEENPEMNGFFFLFFYFISLWRAVFIAQSPASSSRRNIYICMYTFLVVRAALKSPVMKDDDEQVNGSFFF